MSKLGIGIMSFDRPQYLELALEALATNDLTDCDVWLFQDGAQCKFTDRMRGDQTNIDACIGLFCSADLPNARVVLHPRNVGIALNRLTLFGVLLGMYDGLVLLEDDAVVAPQFVAVTRKLLADFADDEDVGFIRSPVWPTDRDPLRLYREFAHNMALLTRREWFMPLWERYQDVAEIWHQFSYVPHEAYMAIVEERFGDRMLCSSDMALTWAGDQVGRYAWTMGAPRARNVGVDGVHCRPEIYHQNRMGEVELREYEGELTEPWHKEGAPCASS